MATSNISTPDALYPTPDGSLKYSQFPIYNSHRPKLGKKKHSQAPKWKSRFDSFIWKNARTTIWIKLWTFKNEILNHIKIPLTFSSFAWTMLELGRCCSHRRSKDIVVNSFIFFIFTPMFDYEYNSRRWFTSSNGWAVIDVVFFFVG